MSTVQDVITTFEQASKRVPKNINSTVYEIIQELKQAAIENSPVGDGKKGLAGLYRSSWEVNKDAAQTGMISSYSLSNTRPQAQALEEGSEPGKSPWPDIGPRTMFWKSGRIFSTQAYEGVISPKIKASVVDSFAKRIAGSIMGGFS